MTELRSEGADVESDGPGAISPERTGWFRGWALSRVVRDLAP